MRLVTTLKRKILLTAGLAIVLSAAGFATAGTAMAYPPSVSLSTSASCSSYNGVATVQLTAKATAKGGATINSVTIDVNSGQFVNTDNTGPTYQAQVIINPASGSYTAVISADGSSNDPVKYATIYASGGRCSVRVSSTPPV